MNIVQLTPGAGGMYCGNCLRDNALVAAYRRHGHTALMVPLYLPLTLDEPDLSAGTPVFFGGINVYLDHKTPLFRAAPAWLRRWLASPALLRWTGRFAAKTRASDVADLTLSMLRGEEGNQARDLDELVVWLRSQTKPDVVCLSNALLIGAARRIRRDLGVPVVCLLAGEDSFLDSMPEPWRTEVWRTLANRAAEIDLFVAPSRYFADRMRARLGIGAERVEVVPTTISLEGYPAPPTDASGPLEASSMTEPSSPLTPHPSRIPDHSALRTPHSALRTHPDAPPVLGYFARMCPEKGLDTLVDAFIAIRQRARVPKLQLKVGGGCGPSDRAFVEGLQDRLRSRGLLADVEFRPNLDRSAKIAFLTSLTVFSVPALYGEAFGMYLLEALAAGVPVVQPAHAAFPEIVQATGGGVVCPPGDPQALAVAIEDLVLDPARRRALAEAGQRAVHGRFSTAAAADTMLRLFRRLTSGA